MEQHLLIDSIVQIVHDYRNTDGIHIDNAHVEKWISQFDKNVRNPILKEVAHVLSRTYISRESVEKFLTGVFQNPKLAGDTPEEFWPKVEILDIQGAGASQKQMAAIFKSIVENSCGEGTANYAAENGGTFLYLDDGVFTGNRVRRDFEEWITNHAPDKATVHVVVLAMHRGGQYYANQSIQKAAKSAEKEIALHWWRIADLEDRRTYTNSSDVLRPTSIPETNEVKSYVEAMVYPPVLRTAGQIGQGGLFSSDEARQLLETEFLKTGVHIRTICTALGPNQRPLGHMTLETLGFGSLIVTFRNCPNNAPLAFWAGDPWYPLFPRSTNTQTSLQNFMQNFG